MASCPVVSVMERSCSNCKTVNPRYFKDVRSMVTELYLIIIDPSVFIQAEQKLVSSLWTFYLEVFIQVFPDEEQLSTFTLTLVGTGDQSKLAGGYVAV